MEEYRLYILDNAGVLHMPDEFEAEDDAAAIAFAEQPGRRRANGAVEGSQQDPLLGISGLPVGGVCLTAAWARATSAGASPTGFRRRRAA